MKSRMIKPLISLRSLLLLSTLFLIIQGCDTLDAPAPSIAENDVNKPPISEDFPALRHAQLLDRAVVTRTDGSGKSFDDAFNLVLILNVYEADGITPRLLNRMGVRKRLLNKYGEDIRIKVNVTSATDAITVSVSDDILERFLQDIEVDEDILWVEPDARVQA